MQKLDEFGRPQYSIKEAATRAIEILTQHQPHGHNLTVNEEICVEILTRAIKDDESTRSN